MSDVESLLQERQKRLSDAVSLKKPDRVPIAALWDYFPARRKGVSIQSVMYDPQLMFDLWLECYEHYQPDTFENPYPLRGFAPLLDAVDYRHLKWAGHGLRENSSYQFVELEVMKDSEYDHFLSDMSDFMIRRFWPRVCHALAPFENLPPISQVIPYFWGFFSGATLLSAEMEAARNALIEAGRASAEILKWAAQFHKKMTESGFPAAAGGFSQVPFDTLGDLFRGTRGIMMDMLRRPEKVMAACERLLPVMIDAAIASVKRTGVPTVFIPLHKCLDQLMSPQQFQRFYWPHMKEMLETFIREGITPWVLVEGVCNARLESFKDVTPGKVVYHFEGTDIFKAKDVMRNHCCIRGNVPLSLLAVGSQDDVKAYCKKLIDYCAVDGGYIMDASTVLGDAKPENVQTMFDFTRQYGG